MVMAMKNRREVGLPAADVPDAAVAVWHVRDLAVYLGMTEEAVRTAVHRRLASVPPGFKLGGRWCWLAGDVDAWLRRQAGQQ